MTQEDEELLIKDLSARLSYGVKISIPDLWTQELEIEVLDEIFKGDDGIYRVNSKGQCIKYIKPYLFPISSMTEEQKDKLIMLRTYVSLNKNKEYLLFDWLNANHFDYRNLIPMGLAINATNLNIY